MSARKAVRWEKEDRVATVWLCDPDKRNAMGPAFWEELPEVMREVGADDELAAVVLCAEGPTYSVGLDLKTMMGTISPTGGQIEMRKRLVKDIERLQKSISSVADCPLPVITALHGYCLGGGVDLASACDVRVASKDLILSVREVKMAMVADVGSLQRLPRIIGAGNMAELCFTGKDIDAYHAQRIGLVNHVYDLREEAIGAARTMADEIAANSPLVIRGIKRVVRYSTEHSIEEGLDYVGLFNTAFLFSEDLGEAVQAFAQKRPPVFKGK